MSGSGGDMGGGGGGGDMGGGGGAESGGVGKGASSGGGESGGSTKGGSGSGGNSGYDYNYSSDVANYGGGGSTSNAYAGTGGGGGSVDDFVSDPTGGNLAGSGPPGGSSGLPGAGGGTNTPFAFDNSGYLSGLEQYGGPPVAAVGTSEPFSFESGLATGLGVGGTPDQSDFATTTGGLASAPTGASAGGMAAPTGIAANPDAANATDLSSLAKKPGGAGGISTGGASGASGILESLGVGKANMGSALVSGIGLANNLINGNQAAPQSAALTGNAAAASEVAKQQTSAGQALQQWQATGTLPDSYESMVQKAAQDAKTRAISNAAAQGLPTDPTQNTALAAQLNAIDAAIPGQREQIAAQLAQSGQQMINAGLQATGISSGVYQTLANLDAQKNKDRGAAIANFATALNSGGNKGLTLKVA